MTLRRKIVFAVVVLLVSLAIAVSLLRARPTTASPGLDAESHKYADDAIVTVVSRWDEDALLKRGSIELTSAARDQVDVDDLFATWSTLGRLLKYDGSKGEAKVTFSGETGPIVSALYEASGTFQNGTAQVRIGLIKRKTWQIASFQVYSIKRRRPAPNPPAGMHQLFAPMPRGSPPHDQRAGSYELQRLASDLPQARLVNLGCSSSGEPA